MHRKNSGQSLRSRIASVNLRQRFSVVSLLLCLQLLLLCSGQALAASHSAPVDGYRIIHTYPHDSSAYTQGLIYLDGNLYEGTGLNGQSSVRMVDLATGKVLQHYELPGKYFGEGLTDWGSNLVELTWKAQQGFVYDRFSLRQLQTFGYTGEGWGLTHDQKSLIMSDGTSYLRFLDPKTFKEIRRIPVTDNGQSIDNLNELEYVRGEIYANIWQTDRIARISPQTGHVLGWIDLSGILPGYEGSKGNAVLNGIAYDAKGDRLFITGKLWPKLFEIKIVPRSGASR
jgi:glutaminyl-peptide cyclotransferase